MILTVRSSKYIVLDKKSMPIVAYKTKKDFVKALITNTIIKTGVNCKTIN